jgi:hypothetical protein
VSSSNQLCTAISKKLGSVILATACLQPSSCQAGKIQEITKGFTLIQRVNSQTWMLKTVEIAKVGKMEKTILT